MNVLSSAPPQAAFGLRNVLIATLWLVLAGTSTTAHAHLGSTKYVHVTAHEGGAEVVTEIEAIDVSMELRLGSEPDERALTARAALIKRWVTNGITVSVDDVPCSAEAQELSWVDRDRGRYARLPIRYTCEGTPNTFRDETVFPDDAQHEAIVSLGGDEIASRILRRGRQSLALDAPRGLGATLRDFVVEGALHFALGYDHVLFILALILSAGFRARRDGFLAALKATAWIVTAFTVGHSVTLVLAALKVVVLPSGPVEALIALSIVLVALINLARPEAHAPRAWVAGAFGLIHGFGFSSVLLDVGLPRDHTIAALLAFNVGIELAQLIFVAVALVPITWAARSTHYRNVVVRGGSLLIAIAGAIWLFERVF